MIMIIIIIINILIVIRLILLLLLIMIIIILIMIIIINSPHSAFVAKCGKMWQHARTCGTNTRQHMATCAHLQQTTPSSHHKIFPRKTFSKGCPETSFDRQFDGGAKIFQGLGPKRPESCDGNRVYSKLCGNMWGIRGPSRIFSNIVYYIFYYILVQYPILILFVINIVV